MGRRRMRLVWVVYLVIGLLVAGTHGYFVRWNVLGNILEGLAAIVLWPLVAIFSVNLHTLIA
jgi:fructose-specific phosphotransferase system IIC component